MESHDEQRVSDWITRIRMMNLDRALSWEDFFEQLDGAEFFSCTTFPIEDSAFGRYVAKHAPRRIVEAGTGNGHFSNILIRAMPEDGRLATFDLGKGNTYERLARLAQHDQKIAGFSADSRDPKTVERARAILGPGEFDMVFIDTDHTVETTRTEIALWLPHIREGGVMAFHDIYTDWRGVQLAWRELQTCYPNNEEFITPGDHTYGIGAMVKE